VEVADDIGVWDSSGSQIEQISIIPSGNGVTNVVKVRLTTPIDQVALRHKFLRLKLTQ
jgi:hypothetical protein